MKPFLLVLLLAIPPMISNLLTAEATESAESVPVVNSAASAVPPGAATLSSPSAPNPARAPAPAAAKPVPSSASAPSQLKPWFM